jgi:tetratricopeptide (TPR) repeat protein
VAVDRDAALKRAEKFLRQGKLDGAIEEYVRLIDDQPRDWASVNALGDLYVRAGDAPKAIEQFTRLADFLFAEGFLPKAQAVYKKILKVDSIHEHTLLQLVEIGVHQGLLVDARQYLRQLHEQRRGRGDARGVAECVIRLGTLEDADLPARLAAAQAAEQIGDNTLATQLLDDPDLQLALAGRELQAGQDQQALQRIMRVIMQSPERSADVVRLAEPLVAANQPERAFACVDIATDAALLEGDLQRAADILQAFSALTPHIPALAKLVEVCVDAGFEPLMRETQGLLADAYLRAGREAEARAITEDLRATGDGSDIVSDDFFAGLDAPRATAVAAQAVDEPRPEPGPSAPQPPPPAMPTQATDDAIVLEALEVDLSDVLKGIGGAAPVLPQKAAAPEPPAGAPAPDLETVFDEMRSKASRDEQAAAAGSEYHTAQEQILEGREDEAIELLQRVARVPAYRFRAASQLAGLFLQRGDTRSGVDWLERAAEAPAASAEEGAELLYRLGSTLESVGESARALAVLMELDADMPGYRDVGERVARLTRVQAESHPS